MNALLIHNDNLPLGVLKLFGEHKLKFDIQSSHVIENDFTFDNYASKELEISLKGKNYDVIYIVLNLNKNDYLEFTAISIISHIRLTKNWNHSLIPVVVLSPIGIEYATRISEDYHVLFSPGVFYETEYSVQAIERIQGKIKSTFRVANLNRLTDEDYKKYLSKTLISPPDHFDSQHSIDNELTLYHWSKTIGIDNIEIQNELETVLYFKYVNVINPIKQLDGIEFFEKEIQEFSHQKNEIIPFEQNFEQGRILLIDDQWQKGWEKFYRELIQLPYNQFDKVLIEKGISYKEIKILTEQKIKKFKPHLILLDLRLIDDDFKKGIVIEKVSGFQLLNFIKSKHPAIQIIITTASTKARTYEATMNHAFSYVQKMISHNPEIDLKKLKEDIKDGIHLAQNLLDYHSFVKKIEQNISNLQRETKSKIIHNLNISSELLLRAGKSKNTVFQSYAYLQLFHVIESFIRDSSVYVEENDSFFVVNKDFKYKTVCKVKKQIDSTRVNDTDLENISDFKFKRAVKFYKREIDENFELSNNYHSLNNKISEILIFRNGLSNALSKNWNGKNWQKLNKLRNDFAHGDSRNDIDIKSIHSLIEFISYLTDEKNLAVLDLREFDLSEKNIYDKLDALKNKYS